MNLLIICNFTLKSDKRRSDVIQIFDSWASLLPAKYFHEYCINVNKRIVDFCKKKNPNHLFS